jgi:hypothetical protein
MIRYEVKRGEERVREGEERVRENGRKSKRGEYFFRICPAQFEQRIGPG